MANFYFFGDSITAGFWDSEGGWVDRLKKEIYKKAIASDYNDFHQVFNLGIPGNNTDMLQKRLSSELASRALESEKDETTIVFAIGINDSQVYQATEETRVPFDRFQQNIDLFIQEAQRYASNIIFVGLTPVDESKVDPNPWTPEKSYKNASIKQFNAAISVICQEKGVDFIPLFEDWIGADYKELLSDGLHPNTKGHEKIFQTVKAYLNEKSLL